MKSIMTINEPKVESVVFSPCEKYLMVYSPKNDNPYAVWNFMTLDKIREFDQVRNENATTYQWSYDGKFIAKIKNEYIPIEYSEEEVKKQEADREEFIKKRENGEEVEEVQVPTETIKSFIAVYELPTMKMIEDSDGNRSSIYVEGLNEFQWAPNKNVLIHTSFPAGENVFPRISFTEIPTRRVI